MPCFTRVTALASLQSLVLLQAPRRPGASLQERSNRVAKMKLAWGSSARLGTVVILGAGLGSLLGGCSRKLSSLHWWHELFRSPGQPPYPCLTFPLA